MTVSYPDRRENEQDGFTHRPYGLFFSTPAGAGTYRYYLGWADLPGMELMEIDGVSGTAIAASGTNYFSFQPFASIPKSDGTVKVRTLGTAVGTTAQGFVADTKRRLHTEKRLGFQLPQGAAFGIDLTVTGSPASVVFSFLPLVRYIG